MRGNIAIVREALSKLTNVSRTWFEWSWEVAMWVKTLVIEVEFDTDPNRQTSASSPWTPSKRR